MAARPSSAVRNPALSHKPRKDVPSARYRVANGRATVRIHILGFGCFINRAAILMSLISRFRRLTFLTAYPLREKVPLQFGRFPLTPCVSEGFSGPFDPVRGRQIREEIP